MYKHNIVCLNCGIEGHTYSKCKKPIKSYGIVPYYIDNDEIKYLLIERKDTIGFNDFIRGRYMKNETVDISTLTTLINEMIDIEKDLILEHRDNFDYLWDTCLWVECNKINIEKIRAKRLFNSLDIVSLFKNSEKSKFNKREFGFPKGRRNQNETNIQAAIREFKEETLILDADFKIVFNFNPIYENFIGSDNVSYSHIYYLAEIKKKEYVDRVSQIGMTNEIRSVGFYNYKTAYSLIREYDINKKFLLCKINKYLQVNKYIYK